MFGFSPPCNMCEIANSDDNMINEWMMVQRCGRNYSKEYDWNIAKEREGCQIFFCKKYGLLPAAMITMVIVIMVMRMGRKRGGHQATQRADTGFISNTQFASALLLVINQLI